MRGVTKVEVKTAPTVTTGITYGTPNLAGLVLNVTYSDSENVTELAYDATTAENITYSPTKFTEAGDSIAVTIKYGGQSTTQNYKVLTVPAAAAAAYALNGEDTGVTIHGNGSYVENTTFGTTKVYKNGTSNAVSTDYLQLPEDLFANFVDTQKMTISFWANAPVDSLIWSPIFFAKDTAPTAGSTGGTGLVFESRMTAAVNYAGICDFGTELQTYKDSRWDTTTNYYNAWKDGEWHMLTFVLDAPTGAQQTLSEYVDGVLLSTWTLDGTTAYAEGTPGQQADGILKNGKDVKFVALGGVQSWWNDVDCQGYMFAKFKAWNTTLNAEQIANLYTAKE